MDGLLVVFIPISISRATSWTRLTFDPSEVGHSNSAKAILVRIKTHMILYVFMKK